MAKRNATSDINHDNWDQPLEAEEAGTFKAASEDALRNRVIKVAKRKLKPSESTGTGNSIFASFGGFKPPTTTSSNNVFGFLGSSTPNSGNCATSKLGVTPANTTNGAISQTSLLSTEPKVRTQPSTMQMSPEEQYLSKLKELNSSVLDWLKTHVEANPYCILTPVFNDYDKHLKQIREDREASDSMPAPAAPASLSSFSFVSSSTSANKFPMTTPTSADNSTTVSALTPSSSSNDKPSLSMSGTSPLASGKSPLAQGSDTLKPPAPSLFGSIKSGSTTSGFFTKPDPASLMVNPFTSVIKKDANPETKPFSFSNGSSTMSSTNEKDEKEEEEDSEEPPKVEFTPIEEEGAVFSIRCKVFVKKENNFKERGVGTLYIKKVGENKHQLLVRAETVLGNVVLNVLLTSNIPLERKGANNVMLVCVPTPQESPPPTVVLLRVKTAVEADQLLETIQKYQI